MRGTLPAASLTGGLIPGFGWLPEGVVEPNFDPGHDRRLRKLLAARACAGGWAFPPESAVLFGPDGVVEVVGDGVPPRGPGRRPRSPG